MGMMFHGGGGFIFGLGRELDQKPTITRKALARIGGYLLPYWRLWALILVCITVSALFGLIPPLLIQALFDRALPERDSGLLTVLALGMIAAPLAAGLIGVLQSWLNSQIGYGVMFDLRNHLYRHLQAQPLRFFTHAKTGDILSRVLDDVAGIQGVITGTLVGIVTNFVTLITTLGLILSMDLRLSLLALLLVPAFILPTRRVGRLRHRLSKEVAEQNARVTSHLTETLSVSGALLIKAFAREAREILQFREKSAALKELEIRRGMIGRWFFMFLGLFGALGPALVYLVGGWLVIGGDLSVGTIVAFVTLLGRLYGPAAALANVQVELMSSMALFNRIFEYLDLDPEVKDAPDARPLPPIEGRVEFRNVSFEYVSGRPALQEVSFVAEAGQLVALVGPSGAGKTTATYLVPRFYDVTSGAVLVDGQDVRAVTLESLRSQMGLVTQETFLFHATIRENLLYGRPEASQEEIETACKAANIHDFILGLPDGYETVVGERGYRLSGGEKQRLAIARVILKNPRILLLDEATSSLDSRSEALIQAAIEPLLHGRTSLVIAHRLSTILSADQILVFDEGRLVEQGTHAALLASGGLYARLYEQQFRSEQRREGEAQPAPGANGNEPAVEPAPKPEPGRFMLRRFDGPRHR